MFLSRDRYPVDEIILHLENPKDSTNKFLEVINLYVKVADYKIITQKFMIFLYTNNDIEEIGIIKKTYSQSYLTKSITLESAYLRK